MSNEKVNFEIAVKDSFSAVFSTFNKGMNAAGDVAQKFADKVTNVKTKMDGLSGTVGSVVGALGGMGVLKGAYEEFQKNEQAILRFNKAVEKSGGAIGLTTKELEDLRDNLDAKTLFGGDDIAEAQTKLISFGTVGGEVFKRTSKAMLDFAAFTKGAPVDAANTLGKALSNPSEALGVLSKQGINFTDEQERMIKKSVELGDIVSAQTIILDGVDKAMGGFAESATQGSGQLGLLKEQFDEFSEELGRLMVEFLVPLAQWIMNTILPIMKNWKTEIAVFVGVLSTFAVAWGTISGALAVIVPVLGMIKAAWAAWNAVILVGQAIMLANPIVAILTGIVAAVGLVIVAFKNWGAITDWISDKWNRLLGKSKEGAKGANDAVKAENDKFRAAELEAEKKEAEEKLKVEKALAENRKAINANNVSVKVNKEADKTAEEKEKERKKAIQDKINEAKKEEEELRKKYGILTREDKKYLKEKEKDDQTRARVELQAARANFSKMTKEEEDNYKDKKKLENKMQKEADKKDAADVKKKLKLTETMSGKQADAIMQAEQAVVDEQEAMATRKLMIEQGVGNARLVATQDFFGQMAQLQQLKSKEMFEVGKAFAIGEAIMNTYTGITKTLATYPFPISAAMAAAQAALGFAQVQQISSSTPQFERGGGFFGGAVGATQGMDNMTAEVRTGEMYLNGRQQRNLFNKIDSNSLGGDNNSKPQVINIYNKTYVTGSGDKNIKTMISKTIKDTEKRKLQKSQFVKGRFAT